MKYTEKGFVLYDSETRGNKRILYNYTNEFKISNGSQKNIRVIETLSAKAGFNKLTRSLIQLLDP